MADDKADRDNLVGSWESDAGSGTPTGWTFANKANMIEVTQTEDGKAIANFECKTEGSSCEIKSNGKKATVSLWFNGSKLVQMETRGSDVVKRRFGVLPQGDTLELEVIPIVPSGKTETYRFKRAQSTSARRAN